jgi:hypothetical protein
LKQLKQLKQRKPLEQQQYEEEEEEEEEEDKDKDKDEEDMAVLMASVAALDGSKNSTKEVAQLVAKLAVQRMTSRVATMEGSEDEKKKRTKSLEEASGVISQAFADGILNNVASLYGQMRDLHAATTMNEIEAAAGPEIFNQARANINVAEDDDAATTKTAATMGWQRRQQPNIR